MRLVWMERRVDAVIVATKRKGQRTWCQVEIEGVPGRPWYEEHEVEPVGGDAS